MFLLTVFVLHQEQRLLAWELLESLCPDGVDLGSFKPRSERAVAKTATRLPPWPFPPPVLLPSTKEPPNFSGHGGLHFLTCGWWNLSKSHTCYSLLLLLAEYDVGSQLRRWGWGLHPWKQRDKDIEGIWVSVWFHRAELQRQDWLSPQTIMRERKVSSILVCLGISIVISLLTMTNTPGQWENLAVWVGRTPGERRAVRESMGKQLMCWTPVFCSLFTSYSHISKNRPPILTRIMSHLQ